MQPFDETLEPWHDFYILVGTASATMIGLLFVAATVGASVFSNSRRGAQRMFLSASVVQFVFVLTTSMIVVAPLRSWMEGGSLILACGAFGLIYSGMTWADAFRDGLVPRIDLEDRLWYAIGPVIGYGLETGAGLAVVLCQRSGFAALAVAMGVLLLVAIHNAWDITIWSVTRRRE